MMQGLSSGLFWSWCLSSSALRTKAANIVHIGCQPPHIGCQHAVHDMGSSGQPASRSSTMRRSAKDMPFQSRLRFTLAAGANGVAGSIFFALTCMPLGPDRHGVSLGAWLFLEAVKWLRTLDALTDIGCVPPM